MGRPPRLLCCLFLALSLAAVARAATRHHEWEISYQFKHSDCVRKLAVTINGQTPGPTIRATQGDTVMVRVNNSLLTENVAIHWHGIRQIGTPWADGTEGVTQCPILPGDVFTYTFVVDRPGTYMYHAHYGMQRSAGLNGLIVVAAAPGAEPFAYDGEHSVLLNDWWHKSTYEQATGLASAPIVWVGEPQALLINGRGRFVNCSAMAAGACNAAHPECATQVFAVVPGKTYRFRIASVTSLSALNFEIEVRTLPLNLISDQHFISFNYPACGFDLSCQKWHCEIPSAITIQIAVFTPSRVHDMVTKRITIII
jgi:FtsP/CotA-like multicopper oxidase with cupredoxin domain